MAIPASVEALFESLRTSLQSAGEATAKLDDLAPPAQGLSLLDVKNELLLSYLQNLVCFILLKVRAARRSSTMGNAEDLSLADEAIKKLVELRLFLQKGVRPVEDKLNYQIQIALRAAGDQEGKPKASAVPRKANRRIRRGGDSGSASDTGSDNGNSSEEDDDNVDSEASEPEAKKATASAHNFISTRRPGPSTETSKDSKGIYRPPRSVMASMPTTERREVRERRPLKSRTMNEYIEDEFSSVPMAQPSIGTNIQGGGRHIRTDSERKEADERQEYEEAHFMRLPKESKKDRAKKGRAEGRSGRMTFGGEDWRALDEGVDRINQTTKNKNAASGASALLAKSRKRVLDTVDGQRYTAGSGAEIGERYRKRVKVQEMGRRDRGKNRR
jgi:U3 small nucleolar ribonucleoprotein protein LCP5